MIGITAALSCADSEPEPPAAAPTPRTDHQAVAPKTRTGFTLFESGQVRPLALSPNKQLLFAVNTPDNRLEVFRIGANQLVRTASIPVGLEPVAVAARTDNEVWVVNHLSDSVSVVVLDSSTTSGRVERTLLVGDEPRDIVFAGTSQRRAFVTTAHRGQNVPYDPRLTTPGVGRADVWVFDALALGNPVGGTPLTIVSLFTDSPRALAVTPDGNKVYAAGFHTGNRTTIVGEPSIEDGFGARGVVGPATSADGTRAPEVGAIVKWNGSHWVDSAGRTQDQGVRLSLPDKDVFVIDAMANPPVQLAGAGGYYQGVGTILYSMIVNPANNKIYVANTEANNLQRFEGPGTFAGHSIRGHLHESRITVLDPGGAVAPRHLNKHIDYTRCCAATPNAETARSLALPQGMAITANGRTLYVAALGSDKIGTFTTTALENDTFVPSAADQIPVTGGGPTGVVLDESRGQLYVMTRFDNAISVINTASRTEALHVLMHNPEPVSIVAGRRFLYDATFSSSHGDSSCATCHVFGDLDSLAWDLGNPDAAVMTDPGPFATPLVDPFTNLPIPPLLHPMKGPMTTQSLRGMANHGPMHWRGDRTGGNEAPSVQPDSGAYDERAAFRKFQGGFTELLGRSAPIPSPSMEAFTDFILQVTYPPSPIRSLDNSLTPAQEAGRVLFNTLQFAGTLTCVTCHVTNPNGNPASDIPGFFGAVGMSSFDFRPQLLKIPHLRNLYQKIGMFGNPAVPLVLPGDNGQQGDQIRGFGFQHDGEADTIFRFHKAVPFSDAVLGPGHGGIPAGPEGDVPRRQLESYVLAFPTNLAPIVGQQITLIPSSTRDALSRVDLMRARADAGECDLVAKTQSAGAEVGFLYVGSGMFAGDRRSLAPVNEAAVRRLAAAGQPVTYTCVPPGSGERIALDRDGDGAWDGDELDAHSDPASASSVPSGAAQ